jgi:hypothetical protein
MPGHSGHHFVARNTRSESPIELRDARSQKKAPDESVTEAHGGFGAFEVWRRDTIRSPAAVEDTGRGYIIAEPRVGADRQV